MTLLLLTRYECNYCIHLTFRHVVINTEKDDDDDDDMTTDVGLFLRPSPDKDWVKDLDSALHVHALVHALGR